jgi:hypothetical protein
MKTLALLLMFSLPVFGSAGTCIPPGAGDGTPLKEYVDGYLGKVTEICHQIEKEQDPAVVKSHAKKLMNLSDEAEKWLSDYYSHKSHQVVPAPAFIGNKIIPAIVILTPPAPPACSKVNRIFDVAAKIRFLHNTRPVKISEDVEEIAELTQKIRQVIM